MSDKRAKRAKGMVVSLEDKSCIITGGASGIGFACIERFLEAGAAVVAVDIAKDLPERLSKLSATWGKQLTSVVGSVAAEQTWKSATEAALKEFGRLDVVVSVAGVGVFKPLDTTTEQEWDLVLGVNTKALWLAARLCVPIMRKQKSGLFLNTGSISSVCGMAAQGAYSASKGAVSQLTRQMAKEYAADGIRTNAVCPGSVRTQVLDNYCTDQAKGDPEGRDASHFLGAVAAAHPVGRIAEADEIARFYLYLASEHASFFNGANLMIDGGYSACS